MYSCWQVSEVFEAEKEQSGKHDGVWCQLCPGAVRAPVSDILRFQLLSL